MNYLNLILMLGLVELNHALTLNSPIVIIGGGVSGIAAANQLISSGFRNVTILEAENRLGGRIYSIPYSKLVFLNE